MIASRFPQAFLLCLCAACCACETTGDPNQGGLFMWSEGKARQRISEREEVLGRERQTALREEQRASALRQQTIANASELARQRRQLSQLLANAEAVEQEAPTPALASRARRLRHGMDRVRQDEALTAAQRWTLIHQYSDEVDALRAAMAAPSTGLAR